MSATSSSSSSTSTRQCQQCMHYLQTGVRHRKAHQDGIQLRLACETLPDACSVDVPKLCVLQLEPGGPQLKIC